MMVWLAMEPKKRSSKKLMCTCTTSLSGVALGVKIENTLRVRLVVSYGVALTLHDVPFGVELDKLLDHFAEELSGVAIGDERASQHTEIIDSEYSVSVLLAVMTLVRPHVRVVVGRVMEGSLGVGSRATMRLWNCGGRVLLRLNTSLRD